MRFRVVSCPHCSAERIVDDVQKSGACPRCGARIELATARVHFESATQEEARAFMGRKAGAQAKAVPAPADSRGRELRKIAESLGAASSPGNRLRLILRRGFEAFGELSVADLDKIARMAGLEETGADLAAQADELGLAARGTGGRLVPLREGR